MPKPMNDIEMTVAEAKANVTEHIRKHGRQQKPPPGYGHHDTPVDTDEDRKGPDWFREGKSRPPGYRAIVDADGFQTWVRVGPDGRDLDDDD